MKKTQGFTLFEIVVVLVMIGLMAALVKLTSEGLTPPDRDLYTQKMLMFNRIAHARNEALLRNHAVSFTVPEKLGEATVTSFSYKDMSPMRFETDNLHLNKSKVTADVTPGRTLTFDKDGRSSAGAVTITLKAENGETTVITVTESGYAK